MCEHCNDRQEWLLERHKNVIQLHNPYPSIIYVHKILKVLVRHRSGLILAMSATVSTADHVATQYGHTNGVVESILNNLTTKDKRSSWPHLMWLWHLHYKLTLVTDSCEKSATALIASANSLQIAQEHFLLNTSELLQ